MQDSILTQVLLPLVLALIMFGMGLSLTLKDFTRLAKVPKAALVGLFGQLVLLPLLTFLLAINLGVSNEIAIGMMILAACPGGTTSNLISHIAKANLALSVSLTAISTLICVITTPIIIVYSIEYFTQQAVEQFSILDTSIGIIAILIVPILLGMLVRKFADGFALFLEPFFRKLAVIFMVLLIISISYNEREMIVASFPSVFISMFTLNIIATIMGVALAKLAKLSHKDGLTLGIEIGTQNSTMAMLIAVSFLQMPDYAIAAGIYSVFMYLGATLLVLYSRWTENKTKH
ncbi:bile acid:sodium symporter family protein [Glaciecola sp. KUL10]|uniref:bile acid:sodium symporter family protein n=1 Tax=Glaciecola sp. (strain KUL10) TaxID=2161813 RepID=UPI000D78A97B|nr:bile acid:sodium symporter family protein [Glaciecola sp. KUL10]GBL04274.1 bile acid:sodium symporter [Glaciecola sp. KUL10]